MKSIELKVNHKPGLILGKKDGKIITLPFDSYFNNNITVVGSSGSMKTISFVLTNILQLIHLEKSIILTDPKGELYRKTSYLLKKRGYNIKVFNLCDMRHSDRFNPLAQNETIDDVQVSSQVIITNTQNKTKGDDFWPRAEENLLKAFEFYFLEKSLKTNSLKDVYFKIAAGDITEIDNMFRKMPLDSPARMSYNIFASGSDTIKASVLTGLGTRLQAFQNKQVQDLTSENDIDLTLPAKEKCAYFCITSDMTGTYDFLSSLFYVFLFAKLVKYADSKSNGKCDVGVYFLLDEFANIGQIPEFNKKISTVRSRDINLIPIVQNIGQFQNRYPNGLAEEIIGNCDTRLCLAANDVLTADYFSSLLGVSTVENQSIRTEAGIDGTLNLGQKNVGSIKRNLLNSDEILRLPANKLLVNLRGNKPLLLDKMIYTEHPLASELKDNPISEYMPSWNKTYSKRTVDIKQENTSEVDYMKKKDWSDF